MTVATSLPGTRPPRIMHSQGMHALGHAGQELYELLWVESGFGSHPVDLHDWQIAQMTGKCLRWVQKALKQLEERVRDDFVDPIIDRWWKYGHSGISGRRISIVDKNALPETKAAADPPAAKAPAKPKASSPVPNVPPIPPSSPEQLAAARARNAAVAADQPDEPLTPEAAELFETLKRNREARERDEAIAAELAARKAPRKSPAEIKAELEAFLAARRTQGTDGQPSGP